jgi:hypothetical protein
VEFAEGKIFSSAFDEDMIKSTRWALGWLAVLSMNLQVFERSDVCEDNKQAGCCATDDGCWMDASGCWRYSIEKHQI